MEDVDYGPLTNLIGSWSGDKGVDWSPEKAGLSKNDFTETIVFSPAGEVENAEEQVLTAIHYHLVVIKKEDDEVIHNETGYWLWDESSKTVMHSFTIPRGVCVLAGGEFNGEKDSEGNIKIKVSAKCGYNDWGIIQSPFMSKKARTQKFEQILLIGNGQFSYSETTSVEIYGEVFEHTDQNVLTAK